MANIERLKAKLKELVKLTGKTYQLNFVACFGGYRLEHEGKDVAGLGWRVHYQQMIARMDAYIEGIKAGLLLKGDVTS